VSAHVLRFARHSPFAYESRTINFSVGANPGITRRDLWNVLGIIIPSNRARRFSHELGSRSKRAARIAPRSSRMRLNSIDRRTWRGGIRLIRSMIRHCACSSMTRKWPLKFFCSPSRSFLARAAKQRRDALRVGLSFRLACGKPAICRSLDRLVHPRLSRGFT
jgi:hypothetical protein